MLVEVSDSNFDSCLLSEGIALVECWAPWCGACGEFTEVFEAAARRHPAHRFGKINTHEWSDLAKKLQVQHIPTMVLFRDGLLLLRQPGHISGEQIDELIGKAEGIEMGRVRADMAKRTAHEEN